MLRHLAQRVGLSASLAAAAVASSAAAVITTTPFAIAAADADADAPTTPTPPPSGDGKRLSPAARAAAILMERRRRKQEEEEAVAKAAAEKAAAEEAASKAAAPPPAALPLPLEPCPERACRGAQDMLAAFAEVRARLKQKEQESQEQQPQPAGPYLWWAEALSDDPPAPPTPPCPPDTAELGRAAWTVLHSVAAYYPLEPSSEDREALRGLVHGLARLYPCAECRSHLPAELAAADAAAPKPLLPPPAAASNETAKEDATLSRLLAERWMCELHNAVSVRLGKPAYDCARAGERWRDGWKDGSCG